MTFKLPVLNFVSGLFLSSQKILESYLPERTKSRAWVEWERYLPCTQFSQAQSLAFLMIWAHVGVNHEHRTRISPKHSLVWAESIYCLRISWVLSKMYGLVSYNFLYCVPYSRSGHTSLLIMPQGISVPPALCLCFPVLWCIFFLTSGNQPIYNLLSKAILLTNLWTFFHVNLLSLFSMNMHFFGSVGYLGLPLCVLSTYSWQDLGNHIGAGVDYLQVWVDYLQDKCFSWCTLPSCPLVFNICLDSRYINMVWNCLPIFFYHFIVNDCWMPPYSDNSSVCQRRMRNGKLWYLDMTTMSALCKRGHYF